MFCPTIHHHCENCRGNFRVPPGTGQQRQAQLQAGRLGHSVVSQGRGHPVCAAVPQVPNPVILCVGCGCSLGQRRVQDIEDLARDPRAARVASQQNQMQQRQPMVVYHRPPVHPGVQPRQPGRGHGHPVSSGIQTGQLVHGVQPRQPGRQTGQPGGRVPPGHRH